jgi:hypothetical protein
MIGVKTVFYGQWAHIWANLKNKRKTKNKRMFLSELACSNIVVQRIDNNHASYMTRVRTKCEMDGKIFRQWFASKPERL